jgi:MYXO-CTERM domain-containing protein
MKTSLITVAAVAALAGAAQAQFAVTEIYPGISGPDGTLDWFEITNTGAGVLDTGGLFFDDDGPNQADGGALDSFLLAPGQSAVFLIGGGAGDIADFVAVWGSIANVGTTAGGGNLSQNGDSVNISTDGGLTFPVSAVFGGSFDNTGATIDFVGGSPVDSVVGINGAFVSSPFFNDNVLGGASQQATLIGSPGVIPAPGAAGLLGLAGLAAARRRR